MINALGGGMCLRHEVLTYLTRGIWGHGLQKYFEKRNIGMMPEVDAMG